MHTLCAYIFGLPDLVLTLGRERSAFKSLVSRPYLPHWKKDCLSWDSNSRPSNRHSVCCRRVASLCLDAFSVSLWLYICLPVVVPPDGNPINGMYGDVSTIRYTSLLNSSSFPSSLDSSSGESIALRPLEKLLIIEPVINSLAFAFVFSHTRCIVCRWLSC